MLNFFNGVDQLPFSELSIINFGYIKLKSANWMEHGQTGTVCREMCWLNIGGKG
jgi:hypothetical protein